MHALLSALQFLIASALGRLQATLFNLQHPLPIAEETAIFALWQVIMVTLAVYHQELLKLLPGAWMERRRRKLAASEKKAAEGRFGKIRPRWQLLFFSGTALLPLGLLNLALVIVWQWPRKQAVILFTVANTAIFLLYRYVGSFLPQPHLSLALWIVVGVVVVAIYLWRRWRVKHHQAGSDYPPPNQPILELPAQVPLQPLPEPLLR